MSRKIFVSIFIAGSVLLLLTAIAIFSPHGAGGTKIILSEADVHKTAISKQDCYLCGDNPGSQLSKYWGQANIGVINLNTMECVAFELNRYDENKRVIEETARYGIYMGNFGYSENGSKISYQIERNRGYLSFTAAFNENSVLNTGNMKIFLCADCFSGITDQYARDAGIGADFFGLRKERWDLAIVYFESGAIEPIQDDGVISRTRCDYKLLYKYDKINNIMRVDAFYCPVRYAELGYDENETSLGQVSRYCDENGFPFSSSNELIGFIEGLGEISEIRHSNDAVFFRDRETGKSLYINRNGTYRIVNFRSL